MKNMHDKLLTQVEIAARCSAFVQLRVRVYHDSDVPGARHGRGQDPRRPWGHQAEPWGRLGKTFGPVPEMKQKYQTKQYN